MQRWQVTVTTGDGEKEVFTTEAMDYCSLEADVFGWYGYVMFTAKRV